MTENLSENETEDFHAAMALRYEGRDEHPAYVCLFLWCIIYRHSPLSHSHLSVHTLTITTCKATAASSQTVGASQTKSGKAPAAGSRKRDPEPKDEEEEQEVTETPLNNPKGNPGGDPGPDPDPRKGGSGKKDGPKGPTQIRRRIMDKEDPIPKLNHLLTGVDNFARWYQGLKLFLDMKDFDDYGEYSYWDIVNRKLIEWDERTTTENDSISYRKWRKANAFILLTIRKNSEEGPFRLVGLCDTGAEALKILRTHYENKSEADLGIAITKVTIMTFKEDA